MARPCPRHRLVPVRIAKLRNPIRPYSWGSKTALRALRGESGAAEEPEAELWIGAHPTAPSEVETSAGVWRRLDDVVRDDPTVLGAGVDTRFGGFPFLLKVLAAEEALSIQAHPDSCRAREGFARENAAGLPLADPRRNYRDTNAKPELLYALTPFWILRGFRPFDDLVERLDAYGLAVLPSFPAFARQRDGAHLARLVGDLLRADRMAAARWIERAATVAGARPADDAAAGWIRRLAEHHPDDPGALMPVLLHVERLEPGAAIYTGAGVLHAYLEGVGVELMASSDNVLRGGLTGKHVDVDELLEVVAFEPQPPSIVVPRRTEPGIDRFETPADAFALSRMTLAPGRPVNAVAIGAELLLCTAGQASLRQLGEPDAPSFDVVAGDALFVPATARYALTGSATIFRAGLP